MKFVQARWYYPSRVNRIRRIYIHSMEAPEKGTTAESVAEYFRRGPKKASAHRCYDNNSVVQCVKDEHTAFHMGGDNSKSIGLEHAGYARQTEADWLDEFGVQMLTLSAMDCAALCLKYDIPPRRLSVVDLRDDEKGIAGHNEGSIAFEESDHSDPGPGFPWDWYLNKVRYFMNTAGGSDDMTNLEFVLLVYSALGLKANREGVSFWKRQLDSGVSRDVVYERIAIADGNPDT